MLTAFNVVVIGDSLPVSSLKSSDFTYRHRDFKDELRLGPAFQASAGDVQIAALPDRFQVTITKPDDLDVQIMGVREVLDVFLEYAGRRSLRAIGHNAQRVLTDGTDLPIYRSLYNTRPIDEWLNTAGAKPLDDAVAQIRFQAGAADTAQVAIGRNDARQLLLDFNFHYDLTSSSERVTVALDNIGTSLATADALAGSFISNVARTEGAQ